MALQDGFKVLELTLVDGGDNWGAANDGDLKMRAPGTNTINVGTGFTGTWSSDESEHITTVAITAAGKNYSSGSWAYSTDGKAIPGEFCSIGIDGPGHSALIIPTIGQDASISFNQINIERGIAGDTPNSDIHDLYNDFSSIAGSLHTDVDGKPNFDWFQGGPRSASGVDAVGPVTGGLYQSHPIRLDEFYGSNYSQYGGLGCVGLGTPIIMADGTTKNIEDVNVGEWIRAASVPGMPLDFDEEDTWSEWTGTPHGNPPSSVWATAYYDIQETNRITPASASVQDIYFDYYENYYLINETLKVTYEHPFFVLRDGRYQFKTTVSLIPGDKLFKSNNEFETIESIEFINETLETVNLNVEDLDVYFGGGYLMHNVHAKRTAES